jgi:predicted alpha/beta-hydrolase family hydrolase
MSCVRYLISGLLLVCCVSAIAEDRLIKVPTRPGAAVALYWMPRDGATATVMLMPGGGGGFGKLVDGKPSGENFLVRSREYFAARGFNVALFGRPSDRDDLDYAYRTSDEHVGDMLQVVKTLKQLSTQPVWIVGTSRGTISAAAAAIAFGNEQLAGIVLTSSVTNRKKPGALSSQTLEAIRIPVLVFHHEKDACIQCRPDEVQWIMRGLSNAPLKKQVMVDGGTDPTGDPCEAHHWHGFIGMEKDAVDRIADWIVMPAL